jgi:hypothetical protein
MTKKKSSLKIILWVIGGIILISVVGLFYIYSNLNRLLTNSLNNGFNSNIISDIYELHFDNLDVNIMTGSVKVFNVKIHPREKPVNEYAYINSTFVLVANKMILKNVNLIKLLRQNKLDLKKIELDQPGIEFEIADSIPVFFPFKPSARDTSITKSKKAIESYFLEEFSMKDAFFHVMNKAKWREFDIEKINLSLRNVYVDRQPGKDLITYQHFDFSIGELTGNLKGKNFQYVYFKDFNVAIDSLNVQETPDTVIFKFANLRTGIKNLDLQTADSIYHITLESFQLNYQKKSIEFEKLSAKPNISDAAMQKRFTYRKEHFALDIGSLKLQGVNFDELIYNRKVFVDEILLDKVSANIYKDLTKPFPPNHRPKYLGQQFQSMDLPLSIRRIKATRVNLLNTERLPDGETVGLANINRATLEMTNITSLPSENNLSINAEAYIENKAKATVNITFDYGKPYFTFNARVDKFDLTDLNALTNSYTPARISKGTADEITITGFVNETQSNGTMKFLYHDLVIDLNIENKAKWKSDILGFAANTLLNASNPPSPTLPVKEVKFEVIRDPRKGFMNMIIKSILDGLKETFLMDKENKRAYKQVKSDMKNKAKEDRKAAKSAKE